MTSSLQAHFESLGLLTATEIREALSLFKYQALKKSELFVSEGEHCTQIGFILNGYCRSYYISPKGEDITYCFRFPGEFVAAYSSFITGQGSLENMQAGSHTELLVISKQNVDRLAASSFHWASYFRMIAEQNYIELEKRFFQLQRVSARGRYEHLLREHPEYIRQIPLQFLASYLGITQRHLSRIRKEIAF